MDRKKRFENDQNISRRMQSRRMSKQQSAKQREIQIGLKSRNGLFGNEMTRAARTTNLYELEIRRMSNENL